VNIETEVNGRKTIAEVYALLVRWGRERLAREDQERDDQQQAVERERQSRELVYHGQ
jgi:hypothetical protein